jgi:hypothetical protein
MEKPVSKGIVILGGKGNVASNNRVIGFNTGIHIEGGEGNRATANLVLSAEAAELFTRLDAAIIASGVPEESKKRLQESIAAMRQSAEQPSFGQRYKEFMALLADHMQVLAPVIGPLLPPLAAMLA